VGKDNTPTGSVDHQRIAAAVREILIAVGEDPDREGLRQTPMRVARMYEELFAGLRQDPADHLKTAFTEQYDELVVLRDIPFNSMCEHHLMPFEGTADVAYLPDGKIAGISKLARVVDGFAHRPQVQERLTSEVADAMMDELQPDGCGVVVEAVHTCMTIRGIEKAGATMVTSAMRGGFRNRPETRAEFMTILRGGRL
jgi:GTP cyclohydrolase I